MTTARMHASCRRSRKIASATLMLLGVAFFTGCAPPWEINQRGGTVLVLVGRSPSVAGAADSVRACALAAVDRAVSDGAELYMGPVGNQNSATWPVQGDFRLHGAATSNSHEADKERARDRHYAASRVAALFAAPPSLDASDDLAATAAAGRTLAYAPAPHLLVLCDDSHQVGSGLNVYRDSLNSRSMLRLLRELAPTLPNLRGTTVVFGAAGLDPTPMSLTREEAIRRFWTVDWARAVHADRVLYDTLAHLGSA